MKKENYMTFKEADRLISIVSKAKCSAVPLLLGATGIGKTEMIKQKAMRENKDCIILHVAQLEPADLIGLPKVNEDRRTDTCPPSWLPYKKWEVPKEQKVSEGMTVISQFEYDKGFVNPNGGYVFLDEINRGHEDIRQALYQLLNDKKIHTYQLPDNYDLVAAANPRGYETYDFDPALVNRFLWICLMPLFSETHDYLKAKFGRSHILGWLNNNQALVDYGDDMHVPKRLLSPRIVANAIMLYDHLCKESKAFLRKSYLTIMEQEAVISFLKYREEMMHINASDILAGKKKDHVKNLMKEGKLDILSSLSSDLAEHCSKNEITKQELKNVVDYLAQVPPDLDMAFIDYLTDEYHQSDNCIIYDEYFEKNIGRDRLLKHEKYLPLNK